MLLKKIGYESQNDYLDPIQEELQEQINQIARKKNRAWSPKRFKKFPRFTVFLSRDEESKEYLKDNIINLNPEFMN